MYIRVIKISVLGEFRIIINIIVLVKKLTNIKILNVSSIEFSSQPEHFKQYLIFIQIK